MFRKGKRKYYGILIACAMALAVDRLWLSNTVTTPAIAAAGDRVITPVALPDAAELAMPELPFPRGIVPLDPRSEIVDLFAPPHPLTQEGPDTVTPDKPMSGVGGPPGKMDHAAFGDKYRLQAVMIRRGLRIANVSGQWMRVGKVLSGCRLTGISSRAARFACYDNEVVLELNGKMSRASD